MASDDVWLAFQPKVSNKICSSNLSQISNFSLGSQNRLSLSCRSFTSRSSQVHLETKIASASSPRSSQIKSSTPRRTPKSSPIQQTPKSSRKNVTPKRKTPQDGLIQKRIDTYFGSETKQISTTSILSDVDVVDLTYDGEEDGVTPRAGKEGIGNQSHQALEKLSNVSRVLFPQTSQTSSEKTKQLGIDCNPSVRGKENLDGNPSQGPKINNSEISPETSVDVFKPPRAFKYKVATVHNLSKTTNPVKNVSNSSDLAKVVSTSTSNGDARNQSSGKEEEGNHASQPRKSTGNESTSSAPSEFNGGEYSVKVSKGKKNLFKKKNVEIDPTKKICSTKNNTEQAASQTRGSQSITTHGTESFENFTGVTECVSVQSSGEMWTPRDKSGPISSDSDDFEMEFHAKRHKRSTPKKNNFQKVHSKNPKKSTISEDKLSNNKKRRGKSSPTDTCKINKKVSISHSPSPVVEEELSDASRNVNKCVQESSEKDFTLSGGFFPEEDGIGKLPGQAFVIRSPSQEYLSCWEDLMEDSSITVEHEKIASDSEKSSILADLSVIDQGFDESVFSAQTSSTVIPNESDCNNAMRNSLSKNTIKEPKESNPTLPYHSNLAGVSLSNSQWNDIPNSQKYVNNTIDGNAKKPHFKQNCDLICEKSLVTVVQGNVTPPLSEIYDKRASSPHEAEVAPKHVGFGVRRSSDAQLLETSPEKAMMDSQLYSQINFVSSETVNSPKEIPCPEYSSCDEIPDLKRVQEWISKTSEKKTSESEERVDEGTSHTKQKLTHHYAISKHYPGRNQKSNRKRCKSCNIKCDVKIFVKSNASINRSVIKNVKRMRCREGTAVQRIENHKAAGVLAVEVQEITSTVVQKEDEHRRSKKTASHYENQYSVTDSAEAEILSVCSSSKRMPIKVQVEYGKWGWEELEIECVKEVASISNDNTNFPVIFCIQEVVVNICYCSRHMQIDCIISKETAPKADSVCRSKYSTSLKNYLSHWGLGDDPITLSVVAYSKLFNPTLDDSFCSTIPYSEKDTIILSSGQFDSQTSINLHTSNSSFRMSSDSYSLRSTAKGRKELLQDSETDGQGTPSGLSDDFQEWMTQPLETEPSKNDAASKWKDLMQRMRSGSSTKSSSSSSLSSLSSLTSQGTSADERGQGRKRYGQERKPKICPFYKIVRGTTFAVDAFSYGTISGVTHYFLSHFHYDHYAGLTKKFAHPIYCSSVTARLVSLKIRMDPSLLRIIDPGQTVVVENTKITALDANHCPGSVMFLFELPNGKTHLHCGDFRAHPCMESYHALWNVDIDQLYLDTTYCDPTYNFPSQQEIINDILIIVEEALKTEPKTLIVCGSYTIGKERVFAAIAENLKAKIWAPYDKFRVLQCVKQGLQDLSSQNRDGGGAGRELGLVQALSLLTKAKEEAQIHVLPMSYLKRKVLEEHLYSVKGMIFNKIIAFRPTGWAHGRTKGTNLSLNSPVVKIYDAAYSEHSSFSEMARFVKFIRPKQVVKTVNAGSPRKRQAMEKHINSWLAIAKSKVPIPDSNNESPKSAKVIEEQKKAGFFQARSLSKTKPSSRTQFLHPSSTLESPDYAALSTQTSFSKGQTQESEFFHSASRVAVKRTCSISEEPPKRRLI